MRYFVGGIEVQRQSICARKSVREHVGEIDPRGLFHQPNGANFMAPYSFTNKTTPNFAGPLN